MGKSIVEIRCHTGQAENGNPILVIIEAPEKQPTSGDYFCRVTSNESLGFRLDVFGITAQQAIRLALEMTAAKIANLLSEDVTDQS